MRRILIVYALIFSVLASFAFIALVAHSETMIDFWVHLKEQEKVPTLPSWTLNAPTVSRIALIFPGLLFTLSVLSLRKGLVSEKLLVHGILITAIVLALGVSFAICAGLMPMFARPPIILMKSG